MLDTKKEQIEYIDKATDAMCDGLEKLIFIMLHDCGDIPMNVRYSIIFNASMQLSAKFIAACILMNGVDKKGIMTSYISSLERTVQDILDHNNHEKKETNH